MRLDSAFLLELFYDDHLQTTFQTFKICRKSTVEKDKMRRRKTRMNIIRWQCCLIIFDTTRKINQASYVATNKIRRNTTKTIALNGTKVCGLIWNFQCESMHSLNEPYAKTTILSFYLANGLFSYTVAIMILEREIPIHIFSEFFFRHGINAVVLTKLHWYIIHKYTFFSLFVPIIIMILHLYMPLLKANKLVSKFGYLFIIVLMTVHGTYQQEAFRWFPVEKCFHTVTYPSLHFQ